MTAGDRGRVRWQCRRALLELDLVLERFIERHFERLTPAQLTSLEALLSCEDHDLWAMVTENKPCEDVCWKELLALIRQN